MSLPKLKIKKFTISSDFSLWKKKMRAFFVHQRLESTLEDEDPEAVASSKPNKKRKHIYNRAYNTLILSVSDLIFREIS